LNDIGRVLENSGLALLALPYDWTATVTPVENWLGGHSQRGPHGGAAEPLLRRLLTVEGGSAGLELVTEVASVPWHVRLHDRSVMYYDSHLVVARRVAR